MDVIDDPNYFDTSCKMIRNFFSRQVQFFEKGMLKNLQESIKTPLGEMTNPLRQETLCSFMIIILEQSGRWHLVRDNDSTTLYNSVNSVQHSTL